ncbi:hypothetical protein H072_11394 [Dactylellina haptotyla CBS 200.50]|uniref:LysM domain-containing protein n=1 Tax=Dactylellina haptotyla (strain CBS 200.50) TaxID=1284197 RepID=S7ZXD4_DACHA|nr:hypothetical protein H072_11394 [Dactylellina haptotyla CBS 200.50]
MRPITFIAFLCSSKAVLAQVNLYWEDFREKGASSACNTALLAPISSCPDELASEPNSRDFEESVLTSLCSTACSNSLTTYVNNVQSACGNWVYIDGVTDLAYSAVSLANYYVYGRTLNCLKDSQGIWCAKSTSETTPAPTGAAALCKECLLKNQQAILNSEFGYEDSLNADFSDIKSTCSVTGYPIIKPTPVILNSTTTHPAVTPTCLGTTIPIPSGANCTEISSKNRISTLNLLQANNLGEGCGNFPASGSLCLPDIGRCDVYRVKSNDTCNSVAYNLKQNVTAVMLQSWNPGIDHWCRNFDGGYFIGQDICVSNPYGPFTIPTVTDPGTSQISTASTVVPIPTSLAPNVNTRCGRYYQVSLGDNCNLVIQRNGISLEDFIFLNPMINSNCTNLWAGYNYCILPVGTITTYSGHPLSIQTNTAPPTMFDWNSLATTTEGPVATGTPIPLANGTRLDCAYYFGSTEYSKSCADAATQYGVKQEDIEQWNQELTPGTNCAFKIGYQYCVSIGDLVLPEKEEEGAFPAPGPVQNGVVSPCYQWAKNVNDSCTSFVNKKGVSLAHFKEWNPAVGSDCQNLWQDTWYCVWGPDYDGKDAWPQTGDLVTTLVPTPTSTTSRSTTTTPNIPGPTREGTTANCNKWALSNTSCENILSQNGITIAQFYAWNPTVNSDCTGMWPDYAYCVGVSGTTTSTTSRTTTTTSRVTTTSSGAIPGPTREGTIATCNKWRLSDTSCANILSQEGITIAQFYAWNPTVSSDCTGMWPDYAYCVGVSGGTTTSSRATTTSSEAIPGPTRDGTATNCTRWKLAKPTALLVALFTVLCRSETAWVTPHESFSSSVGVLGCKIDTNRVAYWPGSVDCNNLCVELSYEGRSVNLLRIDQSGGAFDVSYDAWNYLYTGYSASDRPTAGGAVAMQYKNVPTDQCRGLLKTQGKKLAFSAANSMNFLASCLEQPDSWVAKNYVLYNILDPICTWGCDEKCSLDWPAANQPSCPTTLGAPVQLKGMAVSNIQYVTGKTVDASTGQVSTSSSRSGSSPTGLRIPIIQIFQRFLITILVIFLF